MADFITVGRKRKYTVTPRNIADGVALVDGPPEWSVDPEGGVLLFPAPDGMTCDVVGEAAQTQDLTVTADADTGSGVVTLTQSVTIQTV